MLIDPRKNLRASRDMNAQSRDACRKNCEADFPGKAFELGQQWDRLCFSGARKSYKKSISDKAMFRQPCRAFQAKGAASQVGRSPNKKSNADLCMGLI